MRDPYEVLGVDRSAGDEEIKKAYRSQCKRWHPDLNPNDPTAEEHFKEVQAAYDAITKGDVGTQSGTGYGYSSPYGTYSNGYSQQQSQNSYTGFYGFDPFGFGFDFGTDSGQGSAGYSSEDSAEMQAARNFISNGRYQEARRVLDGIFSHTARWYYLSSLCWQGLGNRVNAMQDAQTAVRMDPYNTEYRSHLERMQSGARTYRTQTVYRQPTGFTGWCFRMILLNLFCNLCCSCRRPFYY